MSEAQVDRAPSLRSGFAWTIGGNAANGLGQWAIISLIARLTSAELLGQYALAIAVATPIAMLAHLNLRSVLATDIKETSPFADYFSVRLWTGLAGVLVTAFAGLLWQPFWPHGCTIILAGVSLGLENFQDLWYGAMQREERLDRVAKSMILRAAISLTAVAALLVSFPNAVAAAAGVVTGRAATFLLFDLRVSKVHLTGTRNPGSVLRAALPLGLTLMLVSLASTIPRYAVERYLGTAQLGIFVAISSFVTIGSVVMNALGQSSTTRLARAFTAQERAVFRRLVVRLAGLAALTGLGGALLARLVGARLLGWVYRPEFSQYDDLLVNMLLAGTVGYVAAILGFVVTSTRTFGPQLVLLIAVAAISGASSYGLVPGLGLTGAVLAIAAAAGLQLAGNLFILRKVL